MAAIRTIIFGLLLLPCVALGQRVTSGRVIDSSTGEPVVGASVTLRVESESKLHILTTNRFGNFRFNVGGNGRIVWVRALGYFDDTLRLSNIADTLTFRLIANHSEGQQVVVTALRHGSSAQESPVSIAVARAADIESRNPKGLDNALRYIPGVTVMEDQLSIRGSSGYSKSVGARVLLMLDGIPFLSADNGDMKFDALPIIALDHIEVVKGAGSALYGSSALGGVVNVITREPSDGSHTAVNLYSGYYQAPSYAQWVVPGLTRRFYSAEAGTEGRLNDVGYLLTGSYKRDEGYRFGDDTYRWNAFAKIGFAINPTNKLTISALAANENHGGWLYWRSLSAPLMANDSLSAVNARIHSFKSNLAANLQSFISDDVTSTFKLSNFHTNFTTDPKQPADSAGAHSYANNVMADYSVLWSQSTNMTVTAGVSGILQSVQSDLFRDRNGRLGAGFAQLEWKPIEQLLLTPGLRADLIKYDSVSSESQISPKFGAVYRVSEATAIRGSYGSGFRAATIGERFISSVLSGFQVRPNLQLSAERSSSIELGANYNQDFIGIDVAGFYSRYRDLIEPGFVTDPGKTIYIQFRNVADALIAGHEEHLRMGGATDPLQLDLDYTYIYPENSTTKQVLQFRPRHLGQASLTARWSTFSATAEFRYVSAYEMMDSVLTTQITDGDKRVDAKVLDLRLSYELPKTLMPVTVGFQVQNILNYYYVEVAGNLAQPRNYALRLSLKL